MVMCEGGRGGVIYGQGGTSVQRRRESRVEGTDSEW